MLFEFADDLFEQPDREQMGDDRRGDIRINEELWFMEGTDETTDGVTPADRENRLKFQMNYLYFARDFEKCFDVANRLKNAISSSNGVDRRNCLECMLYCRIGMRENERRENEGKGNERRGDEGIDNESRVHEMGKNNKMEDELRENEQLMEQLKIYSSGSIDSLISYLMLCVRYTRAFPSLLRPVDTDIGIYKRLLLLVPGSARLWCSLNDALKRAPTSLSQQYSDQYRSIIIFFEQTASVIGASVASLAVPIDNRQNTHQLLTPILAEVSKRVARLLEDDKKMFYAFGRLDQFTETNELFDQWFIDEAQCVMNK